VLAVIHWMGGGYKVVGRYLRDEDKRAVAHAERCSADGYCPTNADDGDGYRKALAWVLRHRWVTLVIMLISGAGSYYLWNQAPRELAPIEDRGVIFTPVSAPDGATLGFTARYLDARTGGRAAPWFAYPFGHWNEFLVADYLPRRGAGMNVRAAFTTEPRPVRAGDDAFRIPRIDAREHRPMRVVVGARGAAFEHRPGGG
jgi:hypothetical protein